MSASQEFKQFWWVLLVGVVVTGVIFNNKASVISVKPIAKSSSSWYGDLVNVTDVANEVAVSRSDVGALFSPMIPDAELKAVGNGNCLWDVFSRPDREPVDDSIRFIGWIVGQSPLLKIRVAFLPFNFGNTDAALDDFGFSSSNVRNDEGGIPVPIASPENPWGSYLYTWPELRHEGLVHDMGLSAHSKILSDHSDELERRQESKSSSKLNDSLITRWIGVLIAGCVGFVIATRTKSRVVICACVAVYGLAWLIYCL